MNLMKKTIYVVDDKYEFRLLVSRPLARDYLIRDFESPVDALRALKTEQPALILSDYQMPEMTGDEFTESVKANYPDIPIIILTAHGTIEAAVKAIQKGAFHYLEKTSSNGAPLNFEILRELCKRAIESSDYKAEVKELKSEVQNLKNRDLIGRSAAIAGIRTIIKQMGGIDTSVLITGETGTGKNLSAELIHNASTRETKGRFVEINCASLPEQLLEAELFGYEPGAFTDARTTKKGLFEIADGGTIFLDEIDSMSLGVQSKLLSFIESRSFRRLSGIEQLSVNVRLICATNARLEDKVRDGKFRSDLFYRIHVVSFNMPPLRELGGDIIEISEYFIARFAKDFNKNILGFSQEAKAKLLAHNWPGNIRELRNVIERAVIFSESGKPVSPDAILINSVSFSPQAEMQNGFSVSLDETLENVRIAYIKSVLKKFNNSYTQAARSLDISQKALWEIRKRHGIDEDMTKP
jgi:two-component system response regulator AtoC